MKPLLILKTYVWIVTTLKNYGPISFNDIITLWRQDRLSENNRMVRQTFFRYKCDLEEFFNISIAYDKKYRYYIDNGTALEQDTVQNRMMSSLSVCSTQANIVTERIVLRAYGAESDCLRDFKLHPSQKEIASNDDYCDFELHMIPSKDIKGKIMEHADRLKVLEPQYLADEIMKMHLDSVNLYKKN